VSLSTSVLTATRSRAPAPLAGAALGAPDGTTFAAAPEEAPPVDGKAGTEAADEPEAVVAGAGAFAVWDADGKKVGFWPLKTCHWSHSKTMEKPKITHKMVRRMSFMTASFQKEERSLV
jgi:hypothetical protein